MIQLYVLEGFLVRVTASEHAERLVLKGGVLLAALGTRRPTRDIDFVLRPHPRGPREDRRASMASIVSTEAAGVRIGERVFPASICRAASAASS